jgi:hypothetical protein
MNNKEEIRNITKESIQIYEKGLDSLYQECAENPEIYTQVTWAKPPETIETMASTFIQEYRKNIEREKENPITIVDASSNIGFVLDIFRKKIEEGLRVEGEYYACDISKIAVQTGKKIFSHLNFLHMNAFSLDQFFDERSVHVIIDHLGALWHHGKLGSEQHILQLFNTYAHVLKTNGCVVVDNHSPQEKKQNNQAFSVESTMAHIRKKGDGLLGEIQKIFSLTPLGENNIDALMIFQKKEFSDGRNYM